MSTPARLLRRLRTGPWRFTQIIAGRRVRPGSVLILVVALLVLLALMGTAYIETTRVDRHSSVQNSFNTEIDLVIDGVCKIEQQMILSAKGAPTDTPTASDDSMIWTSLADSSFICSRVPQADASGTPIWPHLKAAPLGGQFESPYVPAGQTAPLQYSATTNLQPTSITVQTASGSVIYPALKDPASGKTYLAGSSSGSGIADGGLWRLPLGELNGVTYYASAYSVDNGSAVNASIACKPNDVNAALPGDFFPTSIDLLGMLHAGSAAGTTATNQIDALNSYRWNLSSASATTTPPDAYYDDSSRAGFSFATNLEAMWSQLGRRLDNPGLYSPGVFYQALPDWRIDGDGPSILPDECRCQPVASRAIPRIFRHSHRKRLTDPLVALWRRSGPAMVHRQLRLRQRRWKHPAAAGSPQSDFQHLRQPIHLPRQPCRDSDQYLEQHGIVYVW